jgi:hypothetical protein
LLNWTVNENVLDEANARVQGNIFETENFGLILKPSVWVIDSVSVKRLVTLHLGLFENRRDSPNGSERAKVALAGILDDRDIAKVEDISFVTVKVTERLNFALRKLLERVSIIERSSSRDWLSLCVIDQR